VIQKNLTKWFKSIGNWLNRRHIELPEGYGDPEGPYVEEFNEELQEIDHGQHRVHGRSGKAVKKEGENRSG